MSVNSENVVTVIEAVRHDDGKYKYSTHPSYCEVQVSVDSNTYDVIITGRDQSGRKSIAAVLDDDGAMRLIERSKMP